MEIKIFGTRFCFIKYFIHSLYKGLNYKPLLNCGKNFKQMKIKSSMAIYDDVYGEFLKNKNKFIREMKKSYNDVGLKVDTVDVIPNNDVYLTLSNYIMNTKLDEGIQNETYLINSRVQIHKKFNVKIRNSVTIGLANGSHLRFCPYKNNGIEISRVYVKKANQNNGDGTLLMNLFFNSILTSLKQFPVIILECTGQVGFGETLIINNIQNQTKFFRKFGFRVDKNDSKHPYYVKMIFDFKNLVNNEYNIQNLND